MTDQMKSTRHPYAYTLDLMQLAIEGLPPTFSLERIESYKAKLAKFRADMSMPNLEIQEEIILLGKESWPYRKAYEEMYSHFGHSSEESFLLMHLDRGIREKFSRFINEGGKLNYLATLRPIEEMRKPTPFERYFSPEEKFAIEQALLAASDSAREEINDLVTGQKKADYDSLVKAYVALQQKMFVQIGELKNLTGVSDKWMAEIADRVRTIEEGWSVVEQGNDLSDLIQETEYWKGTLQSFLNA